MPNDIYHIPETFRKNSALCGANIDNMNSFVSVSIYASNCEYCKDKQAIIEPNNNVRKRFKFRK